MILYGIRNCSTVKQALAWLRKNDVDIEFHDYKSRGISEEKLRRWCRRAGWENLLNKKGSTWRQLGENVRAGVTHESAAIALMREKTSVIRRPLIEKDNEVLLIGFDEAEYARLL